MTNLYTEFRPLAGSWPRPLTPEANRLHARFESSYDQTLDLLEREVRMLQGNGRVEVVLQLDLPESKIRNDGLPYSNAGDPGHPGIIVSFTSKWGPLRYLTDEFKGWKNNLRAVALSLEALRKVDRYGVSHDGEQYRGYRMLGDGSDTTLGLDSFSPEEAARILGDGAGRTPGHWADLLEAWNVVESTYRMAAKKLHPDAGGTDEAFALANLAYRILSRHHGRQT